MSWIKFPYCKTNRNFQRCNTVLSLLTARCRGRDLVNSWSALVTVILPMPAPLLGALVARGHTLSLGLFIACFLLRTHRAYLTLLTRICFRYSALQASLLTTTFASICVIHLTFLYHFVVFVFASLNKGSRNLLKQIS